MKASILCVGTELVTGKTIESNSYFLVEELKQYGVYTHQKLIVEDELETMVSLMEVALKTSDLIFVTGGLGPTLDDMTREAIAKLVNLPLELDEAVKETVVKIITSQGRDCPVNNYRQAYRPKGSILLNNDYGTAPGFMTIFNGKYIIALPGPPREMKLMFQEQVVPLIKELSPTIYRKKAFELFGIGESALDEALEEIFTDVKNPILGTYSSNGKLSVTITARGETEDECSSLLKEYGEKVKQKVGEHIYGEDGESLEIIVKGLLSKLGLTLSVAESCTGGQVAARLTSLPGISAFFDRGYVTYSNQSKIEDLGVPQRTLQVYGAVSEETALAMIMGIKNKTKSHCGISITGIAGPTGDTPNKPVGLVYIGINVLDDYQVYQYNFRGSRERVQNMAVLTAFNLLRQRLEDELKRI
ncbi:competence/damage-inducible protein A [Alkaliphilus transvaalensis]|uniref:competence/damage-inducible protein A n=1 Tax=Alkaliphilus transvaalensis TaxID=114628 RepID=UPI00047B8189|nr:competence/damage-inducible protein A [Alkaliphilus transvaalensis]